MLNFIVRRVLQLLLVLWGGATVLFFLFYLLPVNPAEIMASGNGAKAPDPQVVANLEAKYGLDKPIPQQYVSYMGDILQGDFGQSYRTGEDVTEIAKKRFPPSFRLAFWAILIETIVGVGFGMIAARKRNSLSDYATTIFAVVMSAIPVFVLAYLIKQVTGVTAYKQGWPAWMQFPQIGYGPNEWVLGVIPVNGTWEYVIQPAIVLASVSTAIVARITRTSMLETARLDHVRTARAKGLREKSVQRSHILRNALIPVVTILGIDFGTMVGTAVLTETVFNLPGLGSQIVLSARQGDLPVVLGLTFIVTIIYGLASLAVDISYAYLNPRVRLGDES